MAPSVQLKNGALALETRKTCTVAMETPNMEAGIKTRNGIPPKTRDARLDAANEEGIISGADGKKYLSPLQKMSLGLLGLKLESLSERMVRRDLYETATGAVDSPEYIDIVLANLHQERARSLAFFDTVDRVSHASVERTRNLLFPVKNAKTAKKRWFDKTPVPVCHPESSIVPKEYDSAAILPLADWKEKIWEGSSQRRMAEGERLSQERAATEAWYDELIQGWNNDRAVAVANRKILAEAALVDQERRAIEPKEPTTKGERLVAADRLWTSDIVRGERKVDQDNRAVEPELPHTMDARLAAFDRLGASHLARGPGMADKEKGSVESKAPASDAILVELDQLWASDPLLAPLGMKTTRLIPREKNLASPAQIEIVKGDVQAQQSNLMDDIKRALERGNQRAPCGKKRPINVTVLDLSQDTEKVEEADSHSTRHIGRLKEHVALKADWVAVAGPKLAASDEPLRGGAPTAEEESLQQYAHFFSDTDEVPASNNGGPVYEPEQHLTTEKEESLEQNPHLLEGDQALSGSNWDLLHEPQQHLLATHTEMGGVLEQHDAIFGENLATHLIDGYTTQSISNGTMSEMPMLEQGNWPEGSLLTNNISRQRLPAPPVEQKTQFQINMQQQEQQAQQPQARMQGQRGRNLEAHGQLALCSKDQMAIQDLVNRMLTEALEAKQQALRQHLIIARDPTQAQRWRIAGIDPLEQCFEQQPTQIRHGWKAAQQWAHPREGGPAIPVLYYSGFKMERKTDALFLPDLSQACVGICEDVHEHADGMRGESSDSVQTRRSASDASSATSCEGLSRFWKRKILILGRTEPIRWDVVPANEFAIIKEIMRDDGDLADKERRMDKWLRKQASIVLGNSARPAPLTDEAEIEKSRNSNDVAFASLKQACSDCIEDLDEILNMGGSSSHTTSVDSDDETVPPHPLCLCIHDLKDPEPTFSDNFKFFQGYCHGILAGMDVLESEESDSSSIQLAMREKKLNEEYDDKGWSYINGDGCIAGGIGMSQPEPPRPPPPYRLPNPLAPVVDKMQVNVRNPLASGLLQGQDSLIIQEPEDLALSDTISCISCKCEDGNCNCDLTTDTPALHSSPFIRNIRRCAKFVDDIVRYGHVWLSHHLPDEHHENTSSSECSKCSGLQCHDDCRKCRLGTGFDSSKPSKLARRRLGDKLAAEFKLPLEKRLTTDVNMAQWEAKAAQVGGGTFGFNDLLHTSLPASRRSSDAEDNAYFLPQWNVRAMTMVWWHTQCNKGLQPPRSVLPAHLQTVRLAPPIQEEVEQEVLPNWRLDKWRVGRCLVYLEDPYDTADWRIRQADMSQKRRRDQDIQQMVGRAPLESETWLNAPEHDRKRPKRMKPTAPVLAQGLRGGCLDEDGSAETMPLAAPR